MRFFTMYPVPDKVGLVQCVELNILAGSYERGAINTSTGHIFLLAAEVGEAQRGGGCSLRLRVHDRLDEQSTCGLSTVGAVKSHAQVLDA